MTTKDGIGNGSPSVEPLAPSAPAPSAPSWGSRILREFRSRPFGYTVLALFVVAGPLLAPLIFPQAPPAVAIVGGLAFGAYAALCAVPQKFLQAPGLDMRTPAQAGLEAWHRVVEDMNDAALDEILAEDVVFHSPVVHTPQEGRALTKLYLMAAFNVLPGQSGASSGGSSGNFNYVREVVGEHDVVLEFVTKVDDVTINGIDMIRFDDDGKIVDFKVMIRPLKAIQKVHAQMAKMLESMKQGG